jgi:pimeloyl-ACP methyl ester carboxylesterase
MKRDGKAGCFARTDCFRSFLQELLSALPSARLQGHKTLADVASITLVAHSAGYRAALALLEHGQVQALVHDVVLLDALYGEQERFFAWVAASRKPPSRLVSLHIGAGSPAQHSAQLLRMARRRFGSASAAKLDKLDKLDESSFAAALRGKRVVIARVEVEHRLLPEAYLGRVLRALDPSSAPAEPK